MILPIIFLLNSITCTRMLLQGGTRPIQSINIFQTNITFVQKRKRWRCDSVSAKQRGHFVWCEPNIIPRFANSSFVWRRLGRASKLILEYWKKRFDFHIYLKYMYFCMYFVCMCMKHVYFAQNYEKCYPLEKKLCLILKNFNVGLAKIPSKYK